MISDLEWLLEPPVDFRSRLKALRDATGSAPDAAAHEESLHALALYRLDLNQLGQLAKAAAGWIAQSPAAGPLARAHLGLVGAGTLDLLQAAIVGSALRHRVLATVTLGDYGNAVQDCIDPESPLREADLDLLLIALDHRSIGLDQPQPSADAARQAVEGALATVRTIVAGASASVRGGIMVASVVPPVEPLFGSFDAVEPGTVAAMVAAFNAGLVEMARAQAIVLVDLAGAAAAVGIDRWQDDRQWHLAKLMIGPDVLPYAADIIARTLAAVRGMTRKCLVLDLDNTLWGGVIGDDGVDGIVIGQGSGHGEAFLAIQRMALALRQRWGVMFQHGGLFGSLTVLENVGLPLREHTQLDDVLIDEIAAWKLSMTGLKPEVGAQYPSELSGGMMKRASLARALALDPELLFLDEPTAGLDPDSADGVDELVLQLRDLFGLTIITITHDLDLLWQVTDRVAVLADGKVQGVGSMAELSRMDTPAVRPFFDGARGRSAQEQQRSQQHASATTGETS